MSFNSFGNLLKLTTFGESHGIAIGGIIDGFPHKEKSQIPFNFYLEFLKEKPQVLPLVLPFKIPIRNQKITITIPIFTDLLMQITPMIKNLVSAIIEVAVEVLPEKQQTGWLQGH